MNDKCVTTGLSNPPDKGDQGLIGIVLIHPKARLDRHGNRDRLAHRANAFRHRLRFQHQASAKTALLNPITGTSDIEIDFVVAKVLTNPGRGGQIRGVGSSNLEHQGLLDRAEAQQTLTVAMQDSARRHHFAVEQRLLRQKSVKKSAMAVGPIEHWGDAKTMGGHGLSSGLSAGASTREDGRCGYEEVAGVCVRTTSSDPEAHHRWRPDRSDTGRARFSILRFL